MERLSTVELCGKHASHCGYCKQDRKTSHTYGMLTDRLTVTDYQDLIDRGWRRSGKYCYKPINDATCCPQYTIRLDVTKFKATKEQNRLMRRMNRISEARDENHTKTCESTVHMASTDHMTTTVSENASNAATTNLLCTKTVTDSSKTNTTKPGTDSSKTNTTKPRTDSSKTNTTKPGTDSSKTNTTKNSSNIAVHSHHITADTETNSTCTSVVNETNPSIHTEIIESLHTMVKLAIQQCLPHPIQSLFPVEIQNRCKIQQKKLDQTQYQVGTFLFASNAPFVLSSYIRHQTTLKIEYPELYNMYSNAKTMADRLNQWLGEQIQGLNVSNNDSDAKQTVAHLLQSSHYTVTTVEIGGKGFLNFYIHSEEFKRMRTMFPASNPKSTKTSSKQTSSAVNNCSISPRIRVTMTPAQFEQESYELYVKYQTRIHHDSPDKCTVDQYKGFLVESPLLPQPIQSNTTSHTAMETVHVVSHRAPVYKWVELENQLTQNEVQIRHFRWIAHAFGANFIICQLTFMAIMKTCHTDSHMMQSILELALGTIPPMLESEEPFHSAEVFYSFLNENTFESKEAYITERLDRVQRAFHEMSAKPIDISYISNSLHDESVNTSSTLSDQTNFVRSTVSTSLSRFNGFSKGCEAIDVDFESGCTDGRLGYGSFHQKYYFDDTLVAVAVIDILPKCLSSVYVFYDPDEPKLQLGKYTALREIQWVQRIQARLPSLKYYYMGFYIHSCPKMRYKADYSPSDLLCPITNTFIPASEAIQQLDKCKYCAFAPSIQESNQISNKAELQANSNTRQSTEHYNNTENTTATTQSANSTEETSQAIRSTDFPANTIAKAVTFFLSLPEDAPQLVRVEMIQAHVQHKIYDVITEFIELAGPEILFRVLVHF